MAGTMFVLPLSLQVSPGLVHVRVLICRKEWSPGEIDGRRFRLRSGEAEFPALPLRLPVEPFIPVTVRLEFKAASLGNPLQLLYSRGMLSRAEAIDLRREPLFEEREIEILEGECRSAWLARALELEAGFRPNRLRSGASNLNEALGLLERYLYAVPADDAALTALERVRLKKELLRFLTRGDWAGVVRVNAEIGALQADWKGPDPDAESPWELAMEALRGAQLEVACERLALAFERGDRRSAAALLLARLHAAWNRAPSVAAEWFARYFESDGRDEDVAHEAMTIIDRLGAEGVPFRGRMLETLAEWLVGNPEDRELAELVYSLAEKQADAGLDVAEDFALLWICYEKAFEQQVAVDRHAERFVLTRLEELYRRLGNHADWVRVLRALADLEPANAAHRERLANVLTSIGRHEEALCARMALWLAEPANPARTQTLLDAAVLAGAESLAARLRCYLESMNGAACHKDAWQPAIATARALLHPDIRPLAALLLAWGTPGEESCGNGAAGSTTDQALAHAPLTLAEEADALENGLARLLEPLTPEQVRELEAAARAYTLTPWMEAALVIRDADSALATPPVRTAALLSLDRMRLFRLRSWTKTVSLLTEVPGPSPAPSDTLAAGLPGDVTDLANYRLRELAKFFLSRAWDAGGPAAPVPEGTVPELIEAVYCRGFPGWSLRTWLEDVQGKTGVSRNEWLTALVEVLQFLRLEPLQAPEAVL